MQAYVFLEIPNDSPWYVVPNSWNHMKGFNEMLIFRSHYGWWAFYEYVHVCVSVCECCFVYVFMWIYNEVIRSAKTSLPWGLERWLAICIQKFIKNKFQCFYINTLSVPLYGKYACKQYLLSMMIVIIHNLNIIGLYSFSLSDRLQKLICPSLRFFFPFIFLKSRMYNSLTYLKYMLVNYHSFSLVGRWFVSSSSSTLQHEYFVVLLWYFTITDVIKYLQINEGLKTLTYRR